MTDLNINQPNLPLSKSITEKLSEALAKSPVTVIVSICAFFITLVLALTLSYFFPLGCSRKGSEN